MLHSKTPWGFEITSKFNGINSGIFFVVAFQSSSDFFEKDLLQRENKCHWICLSVILSEVFSCFFHEEFLGFGSLLMLTLGGLLLQLQWWSQSIIFYLVNVMISNSNEEASFLSFLVSFSLYWLLKLIGPKIFSLNFRTWALPLLANWLTCLS